MHHFHIFIWWFIRSNQNKGRSGGDQGREKVAFLLLSVTVKGGMIKLKGKIIDLLMRHKTERTNIEM